ncbi:MAG: tetraacyldisaccharide 4'-kinase [Acidobacteria bacterium]|jgi:tetraacyldisaccharide 4'-kinase|nr:tetraacyldisaccharide 4'-kinase [Acidobacteriota bacterium]
MQPGTDRALSRLSRPLLGPLSLLYKAIAFADLRRKERSARAFPGLFIISVDSLSFGGAGKTPLVMAIGQALQERGARFAVISRGYRSRLEKSGGRVEAGHGCAEVGDEAMMLKARFPEQEVFIGRDRLRSIAAAAALNIRILILDDGFQSSHIRKDLSILLVNPGHPYHYLRHFKFLSRRADIVLRYRPALRARGERCAAGYDFAIRAFLDAAGRPVDIGAAPLVAFSALGDNERFAGDMRRWRLAAFRGFADHHAFTPEDLRALEALRREKGASWLVCTEKDFCKIRNILAAGAPGGDLQDIPLLRARNEIQLPDGTMAGIIEHAAKKGFI